MHQRSEVRVVTRVAVSIPPPLSEDARLPAACEPWAPTVSLLFLFCYSYSYCYFPALPTPTL